MLYTESQKKARLIQSFQKSLYS